MTKKHLVWDWNGTLFDDFGAVASSTNTVITAAGGPFLTADEQRARFRRPIIDYYSELVSRQLTEEEFAQLDKQFHLAYHDNLRFVDLNRQARDVINQWAGSQSLLSMWHHRDLVPLIQRFELAESFSLVQGLKAELDGNSKLPHLRQHLETLELAGEHCVLIGDTVDDATAALGVGAQVVLYTGGFASAEALASVDVPRADSLAEALTIAQQL